MHSIPIRPSTGATANFPVADLFLDEHGGDAARVVLPRPQMHIVVRFGASAHGGLDVHAMGIRQRAHRKHVRAEQRTLIARLRLGTHEAVLGVPAAEVTGRIVALDELWGSTAVQRMLDRLASAPDGAAAMGILEQAIAERVAQSNPRRAHARLVLDAAQRLAGAPIGALALDLGMSERHLRRVFHETLGISPKTFAKLQRFHFALDAARRARATHWADIAATAGYYDQAHLIADFRAIAGVTPGALLSELGEGKAATEGRPAAALA